MAEFYIKEGDTKPVIRCQLIDGYGPIDLSGTTIRFHMVSRFSRTAKVNAAASITADKNFTAATTDIISSTGHGRRDGDQVMVKNSGGALPAGLYSNTRYYVIDATTNTLKVSLTRGGTAADITDTGTGTHTLIAAEVSYTWLTADTDTAGEYEGEWQVTFGDGTILSFPNSDANRLDVFITKDAA